MNQRKHRYSPSPWYVGKSMVGEERPYGICREIPAEKAGLSEEDGPGEETIAEVCPTDPPMVAEADAYVLAAAPHLLETCESVASALERAARSPRRGAYRATVEGCLAVCAAQATLLRAAVSKALHED